MRYILKRLKLEELNKKRTNELSLTQIWQNGKCLESKKSKSSLNKQSHKTEHQTAKPFGFCTICSKLLQKPKKF